MAAGSTAAVTVSCEILSSDGPLPRACYASGDQRSARTAARHSCCACESSLCLLRCRPFGLEGGGAGARGLNLLRRKDGRILSLGGCGGSARLACAPQSQARGCVCSKNTVRVFAGDRLVVLTPGAGGFGAPPQRAGGGVIAAGVPDTAGDRLLGQRSGGSVDNFRAQQESV